jgi:acyl transferase domain-containing protein/SAM-dependent methyltransferase
MTDMSEKNRQQKDLSPVKQAVVKLRTLSAKLDSLEYRQHEPIAIVGVGLRFPGGVEDADALWRLMLDGKNCVGEVPRDRWDIDAFYDPDPDAPGKMYTRYGAFIDRIDGFDPLFFGISPREVSQMDPQQRLLMEVGWEALENAGQAPDKLSESFTGVFIGMGNSDYQRMAFASPDQIDAFSAMGSTASVAASRLSYLLNLKGPSLAVDTACSSSLVAVHLAVRSLRSGECALALAGGVSLMLTPELSIYLCKARALSPGDKSRTFDAGADGYVRGEGCGMVVLKRLSDAESQGDRILAVILGTAINQDGHTSGITAPNGPAQEAVITAALKDGRIQPSQVGYIEAHGTATPLGDPIEMNVLGNIFGKAKQNANPLVIGSVKTNFGHLEAASGIAGLIKAALAVRNGMIPPHLHLERINPHIPLDQWPIEIPAEAVRFPVEAGPAIAGVSSFGFSGTNAHILLASHEADVRIPRDARDSVKLLTLSAKSESALKQAAARLEAHLAGESTDAFEDICATANTGRSHFNHRLAISAESRKQAVSKLDVFRSGRVDRAMASGVLENGEPPAKVAFLFTGQGSQYEGMGHELFKTQPVFRKALIHCEEVLRPHLEQPLLEVLYPESGAPSILDRPLYTQTALFALEYALVRLWRSWGVRPALVMGHSLGEYAAACAAGVFGIEDGLKLIVERARLVESLPTKGRMVAIFADPDEISTVVSAFEGQASIAALNGPGNTIISGTEAAVIKITEELTANAIVCRPLNITQAFHSPLMDPILHEFEHAVRQMRLQPPEISLISNVSGQRVENNEITDPLYWRRHMREPVRFADAINALADTGCRLLIEIGPQPVLMGMARSILPDDKAVRLPSLSRNVDDRLQVLESLAGLYVHGAAVDWSGFHRERPYLKCALPTYPFERKRYWMEPAGTTVPGVALNPAVVWKTVVASARRTAAHGPLELNAGSYAEKWNCLEQFTIALTAKTLLKIGAFEGTEMLVTVDEILERCSIGQKYSHLIRRWLSRLDEADLVSREDGCFGYRDPSNPPKITPCLMRVRKSFSDLPRFLEYIERCAKMLPDVITGRQPALDTLFPEASPGLAEWLYRDYPPSKYIGGIAAAAVSAFVNAHPAAGPLRIVEIGAGTGGTTDAVLQTLCPGSFEYCFTDISEFFFPRAEDRFSSYGSFQCAVLDIEKPPTDQGFMPNGFQAVVATNVLHATSDLETTITHVLELLAPGGILVLSEVTQELAWYDITTGLIEGWQIFNDHWRGDSPVLPAEKWAALLRDRGFESVEMLPPSGSVAEVLGQHVIIARAPLAASAADDIPADALPAAKTYPVKPAVVDVEQGVTTEMLHSMAQKVIASTEDERHVRMLDFVQQQVAHVLRMDSNQIPGRRTRLMDLGIDSLLAVELRNRLGMALKLSGQLPASLIFDYPTPESIAVFLEETLVEAGVWRLPEAPASAEPGPEAHSRLDDIAELSDDQVERMLLERLNKKQNRVDT